jgi:hypothetical protein
MLNDGRGDLNLGRSAVSPSGAFRVCPGKADWVIPPELESSTQVPRATVSLN